MLVRAQMLGEIVDALGQEGDLHLRRPHIPRVGLELLNYLRLLVCRNGHSLLQTKTQESVTRDWRLPPSSRSEAGTNHQTPYYVNSNTESGPRGPGPLFSSVRA